MTERYEQTRETLLDAALAHVPFDGWSEASFAAAIADTGLEPGYARALFPRGALDLALAHHARGDQAMLAGLASADLAGMRFRDRVAAAVRLRIEAAGDREVVRRAATLFSLPIHASEGARAIWRTCDLIWETLGDQSDDLNWYTKRASLAGVYGATLLFWLGDQSGGHQATWEFLDRRIDDVMQIERLKAQMNDSPLLKPFLTGPNWLARQIRPPARAADAKVPGSLSPSPGR